MKASVNHKNSTTNDISFQESYNPGSMVSDAIVDMHNNNAEDKQDRLIEKIKISISEIVYDSDKPLTTNFSNYLSNRLRYNYTYMANLFSKAQGITIEHYLIHRKIERVKELLILGKLNLTEISYMLHYSSVGHLSYQFKKVTGFTPSSFKQLATKV